jgi:putative hydroxymethylpyrimidine transport system permease protein
VRPLITCAGLIGLWWLIQWGLDLPPYLLPGPWAVARALWFQRVVLAGSAWTTLVETLMSLSAVSRRWLMPVLLLSQAIPVFALAPLLVLWLGFGLGSKITMAALVIFFPVMSAFSDGLRRVPPDFLDLAQTMGAAPWRVLLFIRVPAALPALGSGLRVAAAWAPIGAVIGEWVGASSGLGYIMLNANARVRTDLMFAALAVLSVMTVALWWAVDRGLRRLLYWEAA